MKTLRFRGDKLKELREDAGLSQQALAAAISQKYTSHNITITQGFISKIEVGDKRPGLDTLDAIVDFFDVNYRYLLDGLEEREDDPHQVIMFGKTMHDVQMLRLLNKQLTRMPDNERNEIYALISDCISLSPSDCQVMRKLVNSAMRLTSNERGMITMLAKRLGETQPLNTKTVEADQAADIINRLSEDDRAKALFAVRQVANNINQQAEDLRISVSELIGIIDAVTDPSVRARLRRQIEGLGIDINTIK